MSTTASVNKTPTLSEMIDFLVERRTGFRADHADTLPQPHRDEFLADGWMDQPREFHEQLAGLGPEELAERYDLERRELAIERAHYVRPARPDDLRSWSVRATWTNDEGVMLSLGLLPVLDGVLWAKRNERFDGEAARIANRAEEIASFVSANMIAADRNPSHQFIERIRIAGMAVPGELAADPALVTSTASQQLALTNAQLTVKELEGRNGQLENAVASLQAQLDSAQFRVT